MSDSAKQSAASCASFATDIRPKFTDEDVEHMNDMVGMDLSSYETVRDNADLILSDCRERLQPHATGAARAVARRVDRVLSTVDDEREASLTEYRETTFGRE